MPTPETAMPSPTVRAAMYRAMTRGVSAEQLLAVGDMLTNLTNGTHDNTLTSADKERMVGLMYVGLLFEQGYI